MMNVSVWDKKNGDWKRIESVVKIEHSRKHWFLYKAGGDCLVLEQSKYDLISVDAY